MQKNKALLVDNQHEIDFEHITKGDFFFNYLLSWQKILRWKENKV